MVHYLYVGYFDKDDAGFGRPVRDAHGIAHLVAIRPLTRTVVDSLLRQTTRNTIVVDSIPESWQLWVEDDHVVCNHYTLSRSALQFVLRLAQMTGCDLLDSNGYYPVTIAQLELQLRQPRRWID